MKRINLKKGTARVDENINPGTLEALNTMAQLAYQMHSEEDGYNCSQRCDFPICSLKGCLEKDPENYNKIGG